MVTSIALMLSSNMKSLIEFCTVCEAGMPADVPCKLSLSGFFFLFSSKDISLSFNIVHFTMTHVARVASGYCPSVDCSLQIHTVHATVRIDLVKSYAFLKRRLQILGVSSVLVLRVFPSSIAEFTA